MMGGIKSLKKVLFDGVSQSESTQTRCRLVWLGGGCKATRLQRWRYYTTSTFMSKRKGEKRERRWFGLLCRFRVAVVASRPNL